VSITLAQLEQEVARRTGPFFQAAQDGTTPTTSTSTSALMPTLRSSAVLGGPENLFLVRRGVLASGASTPAAVIADDRTRMVQTFDSSTGRVVIDRNWRDPMQPNELADFIHLHSEQELLRAVLAGLRRCFFADTVLVDPTGWYTPIDLTALLPWISGTWQVSRVQYGWTQPYGDAPFEASMSGGHVVISGMFGVMAPTSMWVTAWHPHFNWVNGLDSSTGPVADADLLDVDEDYAAAAGHIEAWHLFPSRMQAAAAGGFQASQKMAADEFSRQSLIWGPKRSTELGFSRAMRRDTTTINV